jgi:hypothetical protein
MTGARAPFSVGVSENVALQQTQASVLDGETKP